MRKGIFPIAIGILLVVPMGAWLAQETPPPSPWFGAQVGYIRGVLVGGPLAFDPTTNDLWVGTTPADPWFGGTNVSVISLKTSQVVAQVPYDPTPRSANLWPATMGITLDPSNGDSYIGSYDGNVTVVNATTLTVVSTVVTGCCASSIAYDSWNKDVFVTGENTTIINSTTNAIVGQVPVSGSGISADSSDGVLAVTEGSNLSFMDPTTYQLTSTTLLPQGDSGFADPFVYDPSTNAWYGTTGGSTNPSLSVVNATSHLVEKSIPLPCTPDYFGSGLALDPKSGYAYVTCEGSNGGALDVVDARTNNLLGTVALNIEGDNKVVFDNGDGNLYVTAPFNGVISVFSPSAPQPGPTFPNIGSPLEGWAEFFIFLGAILILVGIRRYWKDWKKGGKKRQPLTGSNVDEGARRKYSRLTGPRSQETDEADSR